MNDHFISPHFFASLTKRYPLGRIRSSFSPIPRNSKSRKKYTAAAKGIATITEILEDAVIIIIPS